MAWWRGRARRDDEARDATGALRDPRRSVAQYLVDLEVERDRREAADEGRRATEDGGTGDGIPDDGRDRPGLSGQGPLPARGRMADRAQWVDRVVDDAIARGEFDGLPLTGRPIPGLTGTHDPDWWLKGLVEREGLTGVLPEALQLRTDSGRLHERLDAEPYEPRVREILEEFNARVVEARRQLLGGPPVVTPLRDVEAEVAAWRERRARR
ncbi:DUF1992 domain-containing protein [Cellulomonas endophytica]|uniref:DnaJ family domain-containing protein n=1 Tax=Cellulomonas endophytica TaxID=2494735 RepID=UPI001F0BB8EC|nr:DUF1992 domain-containing protein [Cellulomonas endophytica]